jgi:predicted GNAT superfamily acetyltransferase
MTIEIRPIQTHAEYRAVEQLQRDVWGLANAMIVPDHMLLTVQKNGGLVLGAFDTENGELVGFVFGFAGLTPHGALKHCSHMAGVTPRYQNQNVGYRLKVAQRERVLTQGIDLITWTFDPLESRNARLNFRKLGATCKIYISDLYGRMRDALSAGLPSDRFQVEWRISSHHVADRLSGAMPAPSLSALRVEGVPLLNQPAARDPLRPPQATLPMESKHLLIQIPADFQDVKASDMTLAREWRLRTRTLFETAFKKGYVVTDLLFEDGESFYLLQRDWSPQ